MPSRITMTSIPQLPLVARPSNHRMARYTKSSLGGIPNIRIVVVQINLRTFHIDLVPKFGRLGEDRDSGCRHRQETTIHRHVDLLVVHRVDPHDIALFQLCEHRDMPWQHPDLTDRGTCHHEAGLTRPEPSL